MGEVVKLLSKCAIKKPNPYTHKMPMATCSKDSFDLSFLIPDHYSVLIVNCWDKYYRALGQNSMTQREQIYLPTYRYHDCRELEKLGEQDFSTGKSVRERKNMKRFIFW